LQQFGEVELVPLAHTSNKVPYLALHLARWALDEFDSFALPTGNLCHPAEVGREDQRINPTPAFIIALPVTGSNVVHAPQAAGDAGQVACHEPPGSSVVEAPVFDDGTEPDSVVEAPCLHVETTSTIRIKAVHDLQSSIDSWSINDNHTGTAPS
jgi:hypothetical protein